MIKINLLKEGTQRKTTRRFPVTELIVSLTVLIAAAVIIGIVLLTPKDRAELAQVANVEPEGDTVPLSDANETGPLVATPADSSTSKPPPPPPAQEPPVPEPPVPEPEKVETPEEMQSAAESVPGSNKTTFAPSTHTTPEVIENVVIDRSRKRGNDLLSLTYKEMSKAEKINYEIGFAKRVFELLTRAVPEGIGFGSLTIDSFTVIKATGFGPGREIVSRLFNALRYENLVLRERPASSIRPIGKDGYRFDFACEAAFGVDAKETYFPVSNLKPHETFSGVFKTFLKLAGRDGIRIQEEPNRLSSEKTGSFRRYTYHLTGSASYRDFVKLVLDLNMQRIPCSFSRIQLKARSETKISIDADVVFNFLD